MQFDNYHGHVVMEPPPLSGPQSLQLLCGQFIPLYPSRRSAAPTRRMRQTRLNDGIGRDLHGASSLQHLGHDVHDGLVLELVPDPIAREHDELISLRDLEERHLGRRRDVRRVEVAREAAQPRDGLDELLPLLKRERQDYLEHEVADAPRGLQHAFHVHRLAVVVLHEIALLYASLPAFGATRMRLLQLAELGGLADVVVVRERDGLHSVAARRDAAQNGAAVACWG